MEISTTGLLYLVVGLCVAAAMLLSDRRDQRAWQLFRLTSAVPFWPIYLPSLFAGGSAAHEPMAAPVNPPRDRLGALIDEVQSELQSAFSSLDGWAEDVLDQEQQRLGELQSALAGQAARIRQMDEVLARTHDEDSTAACDNGLSPAAAHDSRLEVCAANRRKNLQRLAQVREQTQADLLSTLAWLRELVSMIHLAKFTGAPASRAQELVRQIAAAVEGISAVTWQDSLEEGLEIRG